MNSRENILRYRRDFPKLDTLGYIELDEVMIYLKLGDREKAKELFEMNYRKKVADYEYEKEHGREVYLEKGRRIISNKSLFIAEKDGYYTIYDANDAHIKYLDDLSAKLNLK